MPRVDDWVEQLQGCLDRHAASAFQYGTFDCAIFAARCVDAVTGSALEAELAAAYRDERTALRFMAAEGGLQAAVTKRLGDPIPVLQALRADVVLLQGEDGPCLGVCLGEVAASLQPEGFQYERMTDALAAWAVGRG